MELGVVAFGDTGRPPREPPGWGCCCWESLGKVCNKKPRRAKPSGVSLPNVEAATLQRWRSDGVGPPYIKLSKAIRYPVDEIVAYEQASRQGMPADAALPPLIADVAFLATS